MNILPASLQPNKLFRGLSVLQAEQAGIKGDYSDETKATGTIAVTAIGSTGDVISVFVQEPFQNVLLATYTQTVADNDAHDTGSINSYGRKLRIK